MLDLKNKEFNKKMKLIVTVLFAIFIICNGIWGIKLFGTVEVPIVITLLYGYIPLYAGVLGSGTIFYIFKKREEGLPFILGTVFSAIMYYIFFTGGIAIMLLIAVISIFFD